MSKLIEIGDYSRAVEFDVAERLYRWVFRREGDKWVPERFAGSWEIYEAGLQCAIKEWKPCKLRVSSDELERLCETLETLPLRWRPCLDAATIRAIVEALRELKERRGSVDHSKLVKIRESDAELSKIALKVAELLDVPLWMTSPKAFTTYNRIADEQQGVADRLSDAKADCGLIVEPRRLTVECSPGGTISVCIEDRGAIFFNKYESTDSPYVYRALQVLAEAIRRDNEEHPQQ
jgi:hypothetical protein